MENWLSYNYPNPFNPITTIAFALPKSSKVTLKIFDILGKEITTLVEDELQPGEYKVVFNAQGLSSDVYFYTILVDQFACRRKLVLIK